MSISTFTRQFKRTAIAAATSAAMCALAAPTLAANLWQPLCPDRTLCATATEAYVADGRVLMSSSDPAAVPLPSRFGLTRWRSIYRMLNFRSTKRPRRPARR